MKYEIEIISHYIDDEPCSIRLVIRNDNGDITAIHEGTVRIIVNELLNHLSPNTKLGVRKL